MNITILKILNILFKIPPFCLQFANYSVGKPSIWNWFVTAVFLGFLFILFNYLV